ncbi:ATP-binding protein [Paenibacillus sp. GYB003]|uniref:ATP-binding protein n=1 Tax=Paenibacillus sp. GYB003 TaxID=2994392 RepID=UPI002F96B84F
MSEKRIILIVLLSNIVLFAISACLSVNERRFMPSASGGVLDLRNWEWHERGLVELKGEWEFVPGRFVDPGSAADPVPGALLQVPGRWGALTPESGRRDQFGYGTYRLRVLLGENRPPIMAVRVSDIFTAHTLYVDGKRINGSGTPGEDRAQTSAANRPYIAYAAAAGGALDIAVHASNFEHANKGGIYGAISLGIPEAVERARIVDMALQVCLLFTLLLFAFIFLLTGVYRSRRSEGWPYFAAYCLFAALYVSTRQEKWLLFVFPSLASESAVRLIFVFSALAVLFFHLFAGTRHRSSGLAKLNRALTVLLAGYTSFCLLADIEWVTFTTSGWAVCAMAMTLYSLALLLRAALRGEREAMYDFAMSVTMAGGSFLRLGAEFGLDADRLFALQLFAFIVGLSVMLAQRYFRAYRRAEETMLQLRRADRYKEEFITHTARELSKPIQALTNVVQSVLEKGGAPLSEKTANDLALVVSVGRRMTVLLNDLTDWSNLMEGRVRLRTRPLDLRDTAAGVLDVLRSVEPKTYAGLRHAIPAGLLPVEADEQRLTQLLAGLLQHAARHTVPGRVRLSAAARGDRVEVRIAGTEQEFTNAKLDRIRGTYERFYPQPDFWTEEGLWLALSSKLVELHGGRLRVETGQDGHGAFVFDLPAAAGGRLALSEARFRGSGAAKFDGDEPDRLAAASRMTEGASADERAAGGERGRVLIVDVDAMSLIAMRNVLALDHIEPVAARYAEEAIEELRRPWKWDLIIVDLRMPGVSGLELCRSIRERYPLFELPVLMMTSAGRPEDAIAAFAAGANDFLAKPVDLAELRARVRTLLRVKRSAVERIRMETAFLQAQIKPHFLFNTLNSIAALADDEPERMKRLLAHFGTYLRESIRFDNLESVVTLERELLLVKSYLGIERERFGKRLRVRWEVTDGLAALVPPLIIQPLVENAVNHGVMKRKEGGRIVIRIGPEADDFVIRVSDDGVGISADWRNNRGSGAGVGLENIERRIVQAYGTPLTVLGGPGIGTTVEIRLPLREVVAK